MKKTLFFVFILALILRVYSFFPADIILGYDQIRDLLTAKSIWYESDLKIIGPTAGNNSSLHHGVVFWYYLLPPVVLGRGNPVWVSVWNSVFNSLAVVVIYLFTRELFKNRVAAFVASFIAAVSNYFISFSGWIGNPSPTLLTVPLFFYFFWKFLNHKSIFLIPTAFFLGLSIQFELFFIYLILLLPITLVLFKKRLPSFKTIILSSFSFLVATSTMVATEMKYQFSGIKDILGNIFTGGSQGLGLVSNFESMIEGYWQTFSNNLWPGNLLVGKVIALVTILVLGFKIKTKPFRFLLIYLLSPFVMLLAGFHGAPWFLIGLAPAIAIASGYLISRLRNPILIVLICGLIFMANLEKDQTLLGADESSFLKNQLAVIDYTYQSSNDNDFVINSVTNPLYVNYIWAYDYEWYGKKKYGYLPTWLGGDQLFPYNTLVPAKGDEDYLYLIIDATPRIPEVHKILAEKWADERSSLIENKTFAGILVQKRKLSVKKIRH